MPAPCPAVAAQALHFANYWTIAHELQRRVNLWKYLLVPLAFAELAAD
jgi:hypothetical protein